MAIDIQQAHALLDLLTPAKLGVVRSLSEVMTVDHDGEELTAEELRALRASDERLRNNGGQTIPFEQLVEELGFTMEQVRSGTLPPGKA